MNDSIFELKQKYQAKIELILEHPFVGMCLFYPSGKVVYANQHYADIYDHSLDYIYDRNIQESCGYMDENFKKILDHLYQNTAFEAQEIYIDGRYYLHKIQSLVPSGEFLLMVSLVEVTSYKRIELALLQANHQLKQIKSLDPVTGISNFSTFESEIKKISQLNEIYELGIVLIDIDRFKKYNAEHGFECGDVAIKAISSCLDEVSCSSHYMLYHLGGDEFVALLPRAHEWNLYTFAEHICIAVYDLNLSHRAGVEGRLTASVATGIYRTGSAFDVDFFLVKLKAVLLRAKQLGGNRWIDKDLQRHSSDL